MTGARVQIPLSPFNLNQKSGMTEVWRLLLILNYALDSMTTPVIWIAGGTDKGNDYSVLFDLVRQKVKVLICMGVDNRKLIDNFSGICQVVDTHSLKDALAAARQYAVEGDTVLLSPCCASFDLFKNYENRGELFKAAVKEL